MNKRMSFPDLAEKSSYINILVNGLQTLVVKNGSRLSFTLSAEEETIHDSFTRQEIEFFGKQSRIPGGIEICRYIPDKDNATAGDWYYLKNDKRLEKHVELAVSLFFKLINNYQNWSSFKDFLDSENQPDERFPLSGKQNPFEYWWLTGKSETSSTIHDVMLYGDYGVFIRPEDSKLPIFTSSLYAEMAGYHYSSNYNISLTPAFIYCPTCFLTGIGAFLGNRVIGGGLLNEQWDIRFYTGDELMNTAPGYFCIDDSDGNEYELTGCTDAGTELLWIKRGSARIDTRSCHEVHRIPWAIYQTN